MKKAAEIIELFEDLLEEKNITITCADPEEEKDRSNSKSDARIYGMEYWNLADAIETILEKEDDENYQGEEVFTVKVVETYDKAVTVTSKEIAIDARDRGLSLLSSKPTKQDAINYVNELWTDGKVNLDSSDFRDVEFF